MSDLGPRELLGGLLAWARTEPLQVVLGAAILGVLVYFYGYFHVFLGGNQSLAIWSYLSWSEGNDLQHGWLVIPAALYAVWHRRTELAAAPKSSSPLGLVILILGAAIFVAAVRTLQPRYGLLSIPFVLYGAARFLWGRPTARLVLFPCAFLLFLIPLGFLLSRTVGLQTIIASWATALARLVGIGVVSDGVTIMALDKSFNFEVAGGCSGVHSLMAMSMLGTLYVHFTQDELWKKLVIFGSSLVFALLGNLIRIFSVLVCAKLINPTIAGSVYHDYSGFIFFPVAVGAMVGFSNLVNRDWDEWWQSMLAPERPAPAAALAPAAKAAAKPTAKAAEKPSAGAVSYDY